MHVSVISYCKSCFLHPRVIAAFCSMCFRALSNGNLPYTFCFASSPCVWKRYSLETDQSVSHKYSFMDTLITAYFSVLNQQNQSDANNTAYAARIRMDLCIFRDHAKAIYRPLRGHVLWYALGRASSLWPNTMPCSRLFNLSIDLMCWQPQSLYCIDQSIYFLDLARLRAMYLPSPGLGLGFV